MQDPRPRRSAAEPERPRGLYSVAQIQHLLRVEFARANRYRYALACLMLGVDQLGGLRDRFGYEFKEQVLDAVVDLLRRSTRASDFLGRTADDRLVVLLPHTDAQGARRLATRMIEGAAALAFEPGGERARVSLSVGVASNTGEELLFHDALYRAAEGAFEDALGLGGGQCAERPLAGGA